MSGHSPPEIISASPRMGNNAMRRLLITITSILLVLPLSGNATTKHAETLSQLCESESEIHQHRCLGYIQGYLDTLEHTRDINVQLPQQEATSAWTQRAIKTRIGSRLEPTTQSQTSYCITNREDALPRLKELVTEKANSPGKASELLDQLLETEFPCHSI